MVSPIRRLDIPPITIPEVKRAVFLAINREAIATRVYFGGVWAIES
jgi:ABC-type transport system substrate-binding protein